MAVQTLNIAPSMASNAAFRAWGLAIHNALVAVGLTNTTDTGQINWATVAAPGVASTSAGYEIWAFSDALQATAPVFIRLDYGTGVFVGGANPQIAVTVGTATDGAGNITANVSFPNSTLGGAGIGGGLSGMTITNANWSTVTTANLWVDSDGGSSLMIAGWVNAAGSANPSDAGALIVVERTRNWDGTPNNNGVMVHAGGGKAASSLTGIVVIAQAATYTGHTSGAQAVPGSNVLSSATIALSATRSAVEGATTFVFPFFTGFTPHMNAPSKHLVVAYLNDLATNAQFQILSYGVLHTFNAWGPNDPMVDTSNANLIQRCFRIA